VARRTWLVSCELTTGGVLLPPPYGVPARVYACNNQLSRERQIGTVVLTRIKVADARLSDTQEVRNPDGEIMVYASRARTLVFKGGTCLAKGMPSSTD